MQRDQRLHTQVQHQVKGFAQRLRRAPEVDGAGHLAHRHAGALRIAFGAVHLVAQVDCALGTGHHAGIAARAQVQVNRIGLVPLQIKSAQPARELQRLPADDRVLALLRGRRCVAGDTLRKNRHAERVRQHGGDLLGLVQRADDEQAAGAFVGDGGHRLGVGQVRGRQQRGDLGAGAGCVAAPATGLADVDKLDGRDRAHGLLAQFGKEALFLGAGDHHVVARLDGFLKGTGLAAAQG